MRTIIKQVDVPSGTSGNWTVEKFTVTGNEFQGFGPRFVPPGTYTRLLLGRTVVMSDTPDEMRDHYEAVRKATGNVLIAGLGLGMVLQAVLDKPDVKHVRVIEKSKDVIALVAPTYVEKYGNRLTIVNADIFEWSPPKCAIVAGGYDCAWFDIWNNLCTDNLAEMTRLKRRYGRWAKWKGCWGEDLLRHEARRQARQSARMW